MTLSDGSGRGEPHRAAWRTLALFRVTDCGTLDDVRENDHRAAYFIWLVRYRRPASASLLLPCTELDVRRCAGGRWPRLPPPAVLGHALRREPTATFSNSSTVMQIADLGAAVPLPIWATRNRASGLAAGAAWDSAYSAGSPAWPPPAWADPHGPQVGAGPGTVLQSAATSSPWQ
jgi:hypothetical protein